MDNEKRMKKVKYYLISGTATLLLGLILVMVLSEQKDTWEYYLSSSRRDSVDMGSLLAWLLVFWGGLELGLGAILYSDSGSAGTDQTKTDPEQARVDWIEGEFVDREWDDKNPRVEWFVLRQENGLTVRLWHNIADDQAYKIGMKGLVRSVDRQITEFIPGDQVS